MLKRIFSTLLFLALASGPAWAQLSSEDQTLLSKAYGKLQDGNFDAARQLAEGATSDLVPALVDFLYLTDKTSFPTFGEAAAFLSAHPDWPSADKIALKAEMGLTESLGAENLAAWFKLYPPKTARGAIFETAALSQLGDAKALQEAVVRNWTSLSFPDEDADAFVKNYGSLLREDDHVARLIFLLDAGLIEEAQHQSHRANKDWQALADARLALQEGSKSAMKLVEALPASVADNPGLKADVVAYLYRREKFSELDEYLLALGPDNGGKAEAIWPIRAKSARRLLLMGESLSAYRIAADHGLTATSGFAELEWLAGWIALEELEKPGDALVHFDRYYQGTNSAISRGKAAYWAARAAEALGDGEAARQWLELSAEHSISFYGQLAAARLGLAPGSGLPSMPKLNKETLNNFLASELPKAALALAGLGDRDDTTLFVMHLGKAAETAEAFHLAGALAERIGRTDLMVKVGKLARNKGVLLIDYLFPLPSLDGGSEPEDALVYALIRQESEFDPQAESSAGALGLMQLMPKTAKKVAKSLGLTYEKSKLTDDPLFNVQLGRAYIAELIEQFDGSYVLATAGYNAGPSRSEQWIELNGDPRNEKVDLVDWIESIPFDETRNYVMRVSEGLVVYRHLLGQTEVADWTGFNPAGQGAEGARQPACCGVN